MLLIIDKNSKKVMSNHGTNSLFPDGNIPNLEPQQDELFVRLHDDSDLAKQIMLAYDYELVLDENNEVTNVIVHKTLEQYQAEQPLPTPEPTLEDYVLELEFRLMMIELGLN